MEVEKATSDYTQSREGEKSVHFSDNIEVPVSLLSIKQQQGGGKGRRRARNSSSSSKDDEEMKSPITAASVAPFKLRKYAEKDRHVSKTGKGRGKPKKGII